MYIHYTTDKYEKSVLSWEPVFGSAANKEQHFQEQK